MQCRFCDKKASSKQGLTYHERRCINNPERIEYFWAGHKHKESTKSKIGKSLNIPKIPRNIFDVSSRTRLKILKRLGIGCATCGWDKASCDIHHIKPQSVGGSNDHSNLTYICPNCHRLAHSGLLTEFKTLEQQIGELWTESYYV